MARQIINIGTTANDGTGDPLRTAFDKINDNFAELYGGDNDLNTLDANLDVRTYSITTGVTNGDITIAPNGTGNINLGALKFNGTSISSDDSTIINLNEAVRVEGALTATGAITGASLSLASGATVTAVLDEDGMGSNSATALATQQSIKAYVDAQVTAQDLDFACDDSTLLSIDLDSESLQFSGGNGITTSGTNNTVTIAIDTGTVVTLNDTQILTNKTLTAPTITSPTLTGPITVDTLTLDDNTISTNASNADLELNPNGTGSIQLQANTEVTGTLTTDDIVTDGNQTITGNLTTGGTLTVQGTVIADTFTTNSNGDITIDPAGTGTIILTGTITHAGAQTTTGELTVDNININANTISSINTNGGINITPNGTGVITLGGNYVAVTNELAANDVAVGSELLLGSGAEIVAVTTNDDLTLRTNGTGTIQIQNPQTQTTVGAGAGANALPGDPVGYLKIKLGASTYVIPYWNQA